MLRFWVANAPIGPVVNRLRDRMALVRGALGSVESQAMMANDYAARYLLERLCVDGLSFVDVGAHIGSVVRGVLRNSSPGRIVVVEAVAEKAAALRHRYPDVIVQEFAATEEGGEIVFFVDNDLPGYSTLNPDIATSGRRITEVRVPAKRLDDMVDAAVRTDVIKIDVEGAELGVLRGGASLIQRDRPTIMFESGPDAMEGYSKTALWEWLNERDYAVLLPLRVAHDDPGMGLEVFLDAHLYPRRTSNYYAVARERRIEVRDRARVLLGL